MGTASSFWRVPEETDHTSVPSPLALVEAYAAGSGDRDNGLSSGSAQQFKKNKSSPEHRPWEHASCPP